ncbi:MAG: LysR family transcriptional regulator [Candidatus Omnitrophica bacterium]|nr:LysR family transcriptional regulator [Candidatus Omnitrophota bacterium]
MELQQLKGFLSVAKYGGFSQAAEKTFRTQPAVSLQIQSLEKELGIKLFDRLGPKKIILTGEGKILFELASPLLEDICSLSKRFSEARGNIQKGSVKVATHASVMVYLLPEVIKKFKHMFPECELSIVSRGRKDIITMLNNGEIDLGITSLQAIPQNIDYKVVAGFDRILITPKGHPLSKKSPLNLEDIVCYPLILPPLETNTRRIIDEKLQEKGLKYNLAMEITGREAVKAFVEMGLGISIINEYYLTKEDKKKLFIKNMSGYFGKSERGILTRKGRFLSFPVKQFINLTVKQFK